MPVDNLSRDEARTRAQLLAVERYDVEVDVTDGGGRPGSGTFRSRTTVRFTCREPGAGTFVELDAATLRGAELNGRRLPDDAFGDARLRLDDLADENVLTVDADLRYSRSGEGLHRFEDPVDGAVYLYTQFETYDAHRMYACFDQPDLKAEFGFTVVAPADWVVVTGAPAAGAPEEAEGGARRHRFLDTVRLSTYVTALVAGPYAEVRRTVESGGQTIDLGWFCRRSLAEHLDADALFEVTQQGFDFYHAAFGRPYPFGPKYDQLFVPEFNAGAMENAACVTYLEDYVFRSKVTAYSYERRAETVLHEMAHMWFGDLVTMRWWDDLWLNESFATWAAVLCQAEATRWTDAWTTFANVEKTWALRQDQLPSTHPVAADIVDMEAVDVNFDGITYAKGASVLKHLVSWVGRDEFLAGVRAYFDRHAFGNTTFADLVEELQRASGRDLSTWTRAWLQTAGVNTLRPEVEVDQDGAYTAVAVRQEATADFPTLRPHRVAIGLYDRTDDGLVRRHRVELDVDGERTEVPQLVGERQPDLLLLNDDDLTYAKLRLDERSLATVTDGIADIRESLPRALCWSAAWDMCRDAEVPARDFLRLVLGGLPSESDIGVTQTLLRQAMSAALLYTAPERVDEAVEQLAAGVLAMLEQADAGSDRQLALVRALAETARRDEHLAVVQGLLSGERSLPGLDVDTDLRWALLTALCARGRAGEDAVAAELERDDTATGRRRAAGARASFPTAEAKERAWAEAVEGDELPNAVQAAVLGGFWQPDQAALLEPYVTRYFDVVGRVWAERSGETAQRVVVGAYPTTLPSPELVERTDAWIAENDPPAALRRLLVEGRASVERALRARERDAAAR